MLNKYVESERERERESFNFGLKTQFYIFEARKIILIEN
jgi:hypothetical protein